tara:strand:+ start:2221 stop:4644 length:2424 start_codon:yes stop_codon:yes gene_type:complete
MKKLVFIIILFLQFNNVNSQESELYHKVKINYISSENFEKLLESGIPLDHGIHKKNSYFESDFSESEIQLIENLNIDYNIEIYDLKSYYKNRNNPTHKDYISKSNTKNVTCEESNIADYTTPQNYDVKDGNNFGGFYTYSEMLEELDQMHQLYPNLISARLDIKDPNTDDDPHIHQTYEGRFLQWVKISDNPNQSESEPQILYTAIHHAREPASLQQLIFYMWYLLENYSQDDTIKEIVDNTEMYFVPCVNPDGYIHNENTDPEGGGMWRKNRYNNHGVDNNRNYSYIDDNGSEVWNTSGTSNNQNGSTYAGDGPFSEAENKAIRYFVENHNFIIALNNHTYSNLLLYPYGYDYNQPTEDNDIFEFISEELVSENGYDNIISADLYPAAGDSDDFMYGMLETETGGTRNKIFAMTPEIGSSFWPAASTIEDLSKEMMYHNLTAAKMVNNYATLNDTSNSSFINSSSFSNSYEILRLGIGGDGNFEVSIIPISDNITSGTITNSYNQMELGEIIEDSFTIQLNSEIEYGEEVLYKLVLNNGSFDKEYFINKIYGQADTIFEDESNMIQDYWDSGSWNLTYEDYFSANTSITDSPYFNYSNNEYSVIEVLNPIDLSNTSYAELSFNAKWHTESGYDYVQIEISTDDGQTWIPQCGKYTKIGSQTHEDAENEPLYDGLQGSWVNEIISLTDYLENEIKIRFKLVSDNSQRRDGFYFDDVKVNIISSNLSINTQNLLPFKLYPNPAKDKVVIKSDLINYNLSIYNLIGKEVLKLQNQNRETLLDISSLNQGLYLIELEANTTIHTFKLIKL